MNHLAPTLGVLEITLGAKTIELGVEKLHGEDGKNYFNYIQYHSNGKCRYIEKKSGLCPSLFKLLLESNYQRRFKK